MKRPIGILESSRHTQKRNRRNLANTTQENRRGRPKHSRGTRGREDSHSAGAIMRQAKNNLERHDDLRVTGNNLLRKGSLLENCHFRRNSVILIRVTQMGTVGRALLRTPVFRALLTNGAHVWAFPLHCTCGAVHRPDGANDRSPVPRRIGRYPERRHGSRPYERGCPSCHQWGAPSLPHLFSTHATRCPATRQFRD